MSPKRITREKLRDGWAELGVYTQDERRELEEGRPKTWGECRNTIGACPFVACKHHLYLDVNPETGSITINFPNLEPWELVQSCSLRVADRGGMTLEEVGEVMNLTRERIRQIEVRALVRKARAVALKLGLDEVEIGQMRQTAMADAQDSEHSINPSEVTFVTG